jgi:antitoxin component of RelBE/YafQ-DinJ toxin-antitoxin module
MNTAPVREKQVNIRLNDEEADRLEFVCRHYGLNGANLFRMLLTREETAIRRDTAHHESTAPASKTTKPARKR